MGGRRRADPRILPQVSMLLFLFACAPATPTVLSDWEEVPGPDLAPPAGQVATPDVGGDELGDDDEPEVAEGCGDFEAATLVGRLPAALEEVSGLAASRAHPGVLWALEDSGNAAELYALDIDGTLLATVRLPVPNVDWEDLALAPCGDTDCLWVADVGDNDRVRPEVSLYVVREPAVRDGQAELEAVVPVRYADGPHNVEALVVDDAGDPVLLSKRDDGTAEVLREVDGSFQVVGRVDVAAAGDDARASRVTAAALWPESGDLLVRTYEHAWRYQLGDSGLDALPAATRVEVAAPAQEQVEAVAWDTDVGGWWQTTEGAGAGLWFTACAP